MYDLCILSAFKMQDIYLKYTCNSSTLVQSNILKVIVHPKMKIWCLSAYPKGIQDVGDFVSSVEHKRRFLTQTVAVCQSYNGSQWDRGFERKKNIHRQNPAARDDTLRSKDTKRSVYRHLSLKWTIDTLSTILIMSVNGPFER